MRLTLTDKRHLNGLASPCNPPLSAKMTSRRSADVTIPISRYDIADYLAISVETVSRALTELK